MVDLTTTYLGKTLRSPLVVGAAAPLTENSVFERAQYLKALQTYQSYWRMVDGTYVRNYAQ